MAADAGARRRAGRRRGADGAPMTRRRTRASRRPAWTPAPTPTGERIRRCFARVMLRSRSRCACTALGRRRRRDVRDGRRARANPRPLPFTYQSETLPRGAVEVEQFVDLVPLRAVPGASSNADQVWILASQFTTEFEVGLTDRLELGLYVTFVPQPNADYADSGPDRCSRATASSSACATTWPIPRRGPSTSRSTARSRENEREIELEGEDHPPAPLRPRPRHHEPLGRARVLFRRQARVGPEPDARRDGRALAALSRRRRGLAARGVSRRGDRAARDFNLGPHVYVGPTFLANFGRLWWSTGALRARHRLRSSAGRQRQQPYGHLWFRTIVGLSFSNADPGGRRLGCRRRTVRRARATAMRRPDI